MDDSRPQHDVYAMRRTASPEAAASGAVARSYRPGEVEEIAVAAVVREALWALIAKRDPEEMPIEALVDEAAMAAGKVLAAAAMLGRQTAGQHTVMVSSADGTSTQPFAMPTDAPPRPPEYAVYDRASGRRKRGGSVRFEHGVPIYAPPVVITEGEMLMVLQDGRVGGFPVPPPLRP